MNQCGRPEGGRCQCRRIDPIQIQNRVGIATKPQSTRELRRETTSEEALPAQNFLPDTLTMRFPSRSSLMPSPLVPMTELAVERPFSKFSIVTSPRSDPPVS